MRNSELKLLKNKKGLIKISLLTISAIIFLSLSILIIGSNQSSAVIEKQSYDINEKIKLSLQDYENYRLKIITPSKTFVKQGSQDIAIFSPEETGNHRMTIQYGNKTEQFSFKVTGEKTNEEKTKTVSAQIKFQEQPKLPDNQELENLKDQITINKPVKKIEEIDTGQSQEKVRVKIPLQAENIKVESKEGFFPFKVEKESIFRYALNLLKGQTQRSSYVVLENVNSPLELKYSLPAPTAEEKAISKNKKEVKISSPENLHYENVLSYTKIPEITSEKSLIRVYWKEESRFLGFDALDTDNDGLLDYIEWTVPHLSEQTFEIIIITKALYLDQNKQTLEDITSLVLHQDNIWSPKIYHSQYIRVTFEKNLTSKNDITFFARNTQKQKTKVEVYLPDSNEKIAEFPIIEEEAYYQVLLTNLQNPEDEFDLKITNVDNNPEAFLEFDHIIDPTVEGLCIGIISCVSSGNPATCTCSEINSDDGTYAGTGLTTKSGNLAQLVANFTNSSLIPEGGTITRSEVNVNFVVDTDLNTCTIHYSSDSGASWTSLDGDCTDQTTESTVTYTLPKTESTLENFIINLTGVRDTTAGAPSDFNIDFINLSIDYAIPSSDLSVTLNTPEDESLENNRTVFFEYTPITSSSFLNCSLYTTDGGTWGLDASNTTQIINGTKNNFTHTLSADGNYDWNVQCFDTNSNSEFSVTNFTFTIDTVNPTLELLNHENNTIISNGFDFDFKYNTTDLDSEVSSCSFYVDGELKQTDSTITEGVNQTFDQYISQGTHTWYILCQDEAGNANQSETRTTIVNISQSGFEPRFWETSQQSYTGDNLATIKLNNTRDTTQNSAEFTISPRELAGIVEARAPYVHNNGGLILGGTSVTFSSSFSVSSASVEITWKLYITNSSGDFLLCQNGDDAEEGTPTAGTISSVNTTCIDQEIRVKPSDRLKLIQNAFNTHSTQSRQITHVWDGSTSSYVDINITTEGFIETNLSYPLTDTTLPLGEQMNVTCDVSCSTGFCRNTDVFIQYNSSATNWTNISSTGNIVLSAGQSNPVFLGNVTSAQTSTNFSIQGNALSTNNIRCFAVSDYDSQESNTKEITVQAAGAQTPEVYLTNPPNETWQNSPDITLFYNTTDINDDIANSTLILNGQRNATNQSGIINGQINNITAVNLADGIYTWTINVTDDTNLEGTNLSVRTFYIDTEAPNITSIVPEEDQSFDINEVEFNFTVTDNLDPILICDLIVDSQVLEDDFSAQNGSLKNFTKTLSTGDHLWNVTCTDEAGNLGVSETRNFSITEEPPGIVLTTPNNTFTSTGDIVLEYNATDNSGFSESRLILNGQVNQTNQSEILNHQINNFTLTGLSEGIYLWTVNVTDDGGLNATNESKTFTVDLNSPNITLNLPLNSSTSNSSTVNFNFTVIDTIDPSLTCTLKVGSTIDSDFEAENGTLTNRQISDLTDGAKIWNVTCTDDTENTGISENRIINITEKPTIQLNTQNNSFFNVSTFNLSYTPTDNTGFNSCSLFIDGSFDQTNQSEIVNGEQNNFTVSGISEGEHTWYVSCNDTISLQNQSEERTFTVDLDGLTVELLYPPNGTQIFSDTVEFSYNATDNIDPLLQCDIRVNNIIEDSFNATSGDITNRTVVFLNGGFKLWNVTCTDDSSNSVTSETRNFTLAFAPEINLTNPPTENWHNSSEITLYYNASDDNDNFANSTLILNEQRNITNQSGIINEQINNFTLTGLTDGAYNWTVNATDKTNLESTDNVSRTFYIDTQAPNITLNSPLHLETLDWNNITFNFTVSDNLDPSLTCNLSVDDFPEFENIEVQNGVNEIRYLTKQDGNYIWNVECSDEAGNYNISETRNFTMEAPPRVTLLDPKSDEYFNITTLDFIYLPEDPIGINNCSLYIDDVFNDTDGAITANQNNSFNVVGISEGIHNWTVECTDAFPDFNPFRANASNFTVDISPPSINLKIPPNNTNTLRTTAFNFTALDNLDDSLTCDLYIDNTLNESGIIAPNGTEITRTITSLSLGIHTWNVSCTDEAQNQNFSHLWEFNVTLPDLFVNSSDIGFSDSAPEENQSIIINATIYNLINVTITNISVAFYDGDPDSGGVQIGLNQTISSLKGISNQTVNVTWQTDLGTSQIFVEVDPLTSKNGSIEEWNENNNKANKSITVESWQFVYGDINSESYFDLADSDNQSVIKWESVNFEEGNIYAADSDSLISWSQLQAIGKNTLDSDTSNDFSDIDTLLGMSSFSDSVSSTYLNASGGIINKTEFLVFQNTIQDVPIANSTNNTNFHTGILWDTSDNNESENFEYDQTDKEDLIFIAGINKDLTGAYGTYDYEIRIPARLREYLKIESNAVVFYTEIR